MVPPTPTEPITLNELIGRYGGRYDQDRIEKWQRKYAELNDLDRLAYFIEHYDSEVARTQNPRRWKHAEGMAYMAVCARYRIGSLFGGNS